MSRDSKTAIVELLEHASIEVGGSKPWDIQVHDDRVYDRVLRQGTLGLGESYMDGWWDVDDMAEMFNKIFRADLDNKVQISLPVVFLYAKSRLSNRQDASSRAKKNAEHHYNVGNDLYQLMLDQRMIYSCGYWKDAKNLDAAQENKLDLICRKLYLEKGMKVLDIGCGWGGFAEYAASQFGVEVTGITPASEQAKIARQRTKGLSVKIEQKTFQELTGAKKYDRIVSVGMLEHVGHKNWSNFFEVCERQLVDSGIMLHHTIGSTTPSTSTDPWVDRYIFPGGVVPSLNQLTTAVESKLIIEDVHNFGPDYDRTTMEWWNNFDQNYDKLKDKYNERFYRMWRYYLLHFSGAFRSRNLHLWQVVLRKKHHPTQYISVR